MMGLRTRGRVTRSRRRGRVQGTRKGRAKGCLGRSGDGRTDCIRSQGEGLWGRTLSGPWAEASAKPPRAQPPPLPSWKET